MDGAHLAKKAAHKVFDVAKQLYADLEEGDIINHASTMAYISLFSLIPSLAAIFAMMSLGTSMFGAGSNLVSHIRELILRHLTAGSGQQAVTYLENFLANTDFAKIGITGFVGTIVTLILLLKQIEVALNNIFKVTKPRSLLMRFIYFWTFLTLGTFTLTLSLAMLSSSAFLKETFDGSLTALLVGDFAYNLSILGFFFLLYKVVPNRHIGWKNALLGSISATLLFVLAVKLFTIYIDNFTKYQAIYGALAVVPIFLLWLYTMWFIALFGAVITKRSMYSLTAIDIVRLSRQSNININYLRSLLPFLVLIKIYEAFRTTSNSGISAYAIADELRVEVDDIEFAFDLLTDKGLIVPLRDESQAWELHAYFPRIAAEQLTMQELKKQLLGSEHEWFNETQLPETTRPYYQKLTQALLEGEQATLASLL
jgi:membrane protein